MFGVDEGVWGLLIPDISNFLQEVCGYKPVACCKPMPKEKSASPSKTGVKLPKQDCLGEVIDRTATPLDDVIERRGVEPRVQEPCPDTPWNSYTFQIHTCHSFTPSMIFLGWINRLGCASL